MLFLTEENQLKIQDKTVLYFYASWMPYHKKMIIMIDKMEQKHPELNFLAIDTDYFKSMCRRFGIESVPTVLLLNAGKEKKRLVGLILTSAFRSAFHDI